MRRDPASSLPEVTLTFLVTADLGGRLTNVHCEAPSENGPDLADLVASVDMERARLAAARQPPPIVIDTGDLIGPAAVTRFLLSYDPSGPGRLAGLLGRMGYDLNVLGNDELALPTGQLAQVLGAAQGGLSYGAANLTCDPAVSSLCGVLNGGGVSESGYRLIVRSGLRIALVPLTRNDLPSDVHPRNVAGLVFRDPVFAAHQAALRARTADRADLVVLVAHLDEIGTTPRRALQLARRLPGVDMLLVGSLRPDRGGYGLTELRFADDDFAPIFGPGLSRYQPLRVSVKLFHHKGRFRVAWASSEHLYPLGPDTEVADALGQIRTDYCRAWGEALGGSAISSPMEPEDFVAYLLRVMQFESGREIAVINRGAIDLPGWPLLSGSITRDLLFRALPFENRLVDFTLTGEQLRKWLDVVWERATNLDPAGLHIAGVAKEGGSYRVNGRAVDDAQRYSIVTIQFLAEGGDAFLEPLPPGLELEEVEPEEGQAEALTVRGLLERWFGERRYEALTGAETVSLETNFPSLADRLVWSITGDVNFLFNQTNVENGAGYTNQSQLSRDEFLGIETNSKLRLDAQSRLHEWITQLELSYAYASVADESFSESKDLLTAETAYSWLYVRNVLAEESPWTPVPVLRLRIETELNQADDAPFRHLELSALAGIKWLFTDKITSSLGYVFLTEVYDPAQDLNHGLDFRFQVQRQPLVDLFAAPLYLETRFDLSYTDIGEADTVKGLFSSKLAYTLAGPLALTLSFDAFGYKTGSRPFAFSTDFMVGLQLYLATHLQEFR